MRWWDDAIDDWNAENVSLWENQQLIYLLYPTAVEEHQAFQRKITETQNEIKKKDSIIVKLASELREVESVLEMVCACFCFCFFFSSFSNVVFCVIRSCSWSKDDCFYFHHLSHQRFTSNIKKGRRGCENEAEVCSTINRTYVHSIS